MVLRLEPGNTDSDPAEAVANAKYFQFTVTANCGYVLNLNSLTFSAGRGGDTGLPRGWVLLSDVDGFTYYIDTQDVPTTRPVMADFTVDLNGSQFQNLTEVTFRMYSYLTGNGRSVDYGPITLNGIVVSQ